MNPLLLVDNYKLDHFRMYNPGLTKLYSNLTPRQSRIAGIDGVVVFGIQHFIKKYLIKKFNKKFFNKPLEKVLEEYKKHVKLDSYNHIIYLHKLGYLPIELKALQEGTVCPIGVPLLTITNTNSNCAWLVNYLETLISTQLWQTITSATLARKYRKIIDKWSLKTTGSTEGNEWMGHDFSMRGMSSVESSILSGMGHLLSFNGTDVVPAIYQMEKYYNVDHLIAGGVPATEHSVMCAGTKEGEINTFRRLFKLYPTGILSVVSDTWDLWKVCTEYLPQLKEEILARDGKLVIRPDSGNPADIICGTNNLMSDKYINGLPKRYSNEAKGAIELLWDVFGGTINDKGYKVLDFHIGLIYGDSIGLHNLDEINSRLEAKGFASINWVAGFGSYGYQYNTRDTYGFAIKATYCEITHGYRILGSNNNDIEAREIFKDPITDDGTKKSKKGLLQVNNCPIEHTISCRDQMSWEQESKGLLTTVFKDSKLVRETTLEEIRSRIKES